MTNGQMVNDENPGNAEVGEVELSTADEEIDLEALAEELYALLREELRLERERRGWREVW